MRQGADRVSSDANHTVVEEDRSGLSASGLSQGFSGRDQAAAERDRQAALRDEYARHRDLLAQARDRAAELADYGAERLARQVGEADPNIRAALEAAAEVRIRAATARAQAAADRKRAAKDREAAGNDRDLLHGELERAHLDELTGAYRRGMGEILMLHEIERARRSRGKLALAFIDVDELKQINDRYGHCAGDAVLRGVFAALKARLRPYDPIVRWGGDEFVCSIACSALKVAQRCVQGARLDLAESHPGASISTGVAELEDEDTLLTLIERADGAMLQAKRGEAGLVSGREPKPDPGKDRTAVALGRRGGRKGSKARADKMTLEQRREAAKRAAQDRWKKKP